MQNVMWAIMIWPIEPFMPSSWLKKISRLMPMMISGVTIGSRSSVSVAPAPRNLSRARPRPSSVPRIVATITATNATWTVTHRASSRSRLANSFGYQSVVKPSHTKFRRDWLKLKMISTTIGANRNT